MKRFIYVLIAVVVLSNVQATLAARCTGSANCRACKTCSSCAHCSAGGTCGVCAGGSSSGSSSNSSSSVAPSTPSRVTTPRDTPTPRTTTPPTAKPQKPEELLSDYPFAAASEGGITVYFSPNGHCTDAIVEQIGKSVLEVKVQA